MCQILKDLDSVINWFVNSLKIIFPDTPYKQGVLLKAADDNELKRGFGALFKILQYRRRWSKINRSTI